MRDDEFLKERLESIWKFLFPDLERKNNVHIKFRGKSRSKFGHIRKLRNGDSEIVINQFFNDGRVPEYIIDLTIAHELVHYMHGFNSPLPRVYKHPHKGGIVNKELKRRGFDNMLKLEKIWIINQWKTIANGELKTGKRNGFFKFF